MTAAAQHRVETPNSAGRSPGSLDSLLRFDLAIGRRSKHGCAARLSH